MNDFGMNFLFVAPLVLLAFVVVSFVARVVLVAVLYYRLRRALVKAIRDAQLQLAEKGPKDE